MSSEAEQFFVEHGFPEGFVARRNGRIVTKSDVKELFDRIHSVFKVAEVFSISVSTVSKIVDAGKGDYGGIGTIFLSSKVLKKYESVTCYGKRHDESCRSIAERFGVSVSTVYKVLKANGIVFKGLTGMHTKLHKAEDGHVVRSFGELKVDDWLYEHDVEHEVGKRIRFDARSVIVDFQLSKT